MKENRGIGAILTLLAAVLAAIAIVLYGGVMYKYQPVYFMLGGAAILGALGFAAAKALPSASCFMPVVMTALLASAAVWGSQLMVNQIGYVVAGLDGMNSIMPWIYFLAVTVVGMLVSLVASFLRSTRKAQ